MVAMLQVWAVFSACPCRATNVCWCCACLQFFVVEQITECTLLESRLLGKGVASRLRCCRCGRYSLGRPMSVGVVLPLSVLC